jgi:hypothetical protein
MIRSFTRNQRACILIAHFIIAFIKSNNQQITGYNATGKKEKN